MTTPKPCESGACIHVHEEGGIVHIRSTETGDSMTATLPEWQDYLDAVTRNARLEATQAVDREWCRNVDLATDRPDGQPFFEAVAEAIRAQHRDRIAELELANKTLEIALKHSADLNEALQTQAHKVLAALNEHPCSNCNHIHADVPCPVDLVAGRSDWGCNCDWGPAEIVTKIRNIYAGKEQS